MQVPGNSQDLKEDRLQTDEALQICGYYILRQWGCRLSKQPALQSTSCTHTALFPNTITDNLHLAQKNEYKVRGNHLNFFRLHHHVRARSPKHLELHTPSFSRGKRPHKRNPCACHPAGCCFEWASATAWLFERILQVPPPPECQSWRTLQILRGSCYRVVQ